MPVCAPFCARETTTARPTACGLSQQRRALPPCKSSAQAFDLSSRPTARDNSGRCFNREDHMSKRNDIKTTRRRFLTAAAAGGAAIAMPQVSRAQTATLKMQGSWGKADIFHEMADDYAKRVNDMSGRPPALDVLAAGAVVPAFQMADARAFRRSSMRPRCRRTGTASTRPIRCSAPPPSFGWDAHWLPRLVLLRRRRGAVQGTGQQHPEAQPHRLPVLSRCRPSRSAGSRRRSRPAMTSRA